MKNYYELLEVNTNASQEVIEKAYRVLAKKYHPDVQPRDKIFWAESEFKKVSEAYTVLSDQERRVVYDFENGFASGDTSYEQKYKNLYSEQEELKKELEFLKNNQTNEPPQNINNNNKQRLRDLTNFKPYTKKISQLIYDETQKSKEERSKDIKAFIIAILIMILVIFLFWKVPFFRNILFPS